MVVGGREGGGVVVGGGGVVVGEEGGVGGSGGGQVCGNDQAASNQPLVLVSYGSGQEVLQCCHTARQPAIDNAWGLSVVLTLLFAYGSQPFLH